jgi:hypothetical protein
MKHTELLWLALNAWLVANNHVLGRPTAFTNGSTWRYVDWPVSQAIVRASERDRFHDLFERFGFTGSETISRREMSHYLASWMLTSRPNARLKNAWNKKELRDRISEAAVAELATWSGSSNAEGLGRERRTGRLSLLANIVPRLAGPVLELHLGFLGEQDEPASLASEGEQFQLANDRFGSFATISPSPFQAGNQGLGRLHEFTQSGTERHFSWQPRLVIPLAKSTQGSLWAEAMRASFGVPHMLLVRDTNNLPQKVEAYLTRAMSGPPGRATPGELKGLPAGWVLYSDVIISTMDVTAEYRDLECLLPLGDGAALEVDGGLQLLPGFYHARSRPTAHLVMPEGPSRIDAIPLGGKAPLASVSDPSNQVAMELDASALGHDAIELLGYHGEELVEQEEVFFRDANKPTPLHRSGRGQLSYANIVSARPGGPGHGLSVTGMVVEGEVGELAALASGDDSEMALPGGQDESVQEATSSAIEQQATRQACIENGYHIWRFPMVPENTPRGTPFEGRCTSCDLPLTIVYKPRHRTAVQVPRPTLGAVRAIRVPATEDGQRVDVDLLLDALSFLGSGPWSKFESLLESLDPAQGYTRQLAQQFSALGFLDLELRKGPGAIKSWSVPAPSLNFTGRTRAFLSGFRSSNLVAEIIELATLAGGAIAKERVDGAPTAIFIDGLAPSTLREALDGVVDPHGRPVQLNEAPGHRLAATCLAFPALGSWLVPASIGRTRNLQRFDLHSAEWKDLERVDGVGCYRWNEGYQAYAFVDRNRHATAGPYQVVKLLAARAEGIRLHAYDARRQLFRSTLGSEPPGLLSRALVACSGVLPVRQGGTLVHANVPPAVGQAILAILYPQENDD